MAKRELVDLYELLQVSPSAEPDTVRRVYRLLARRFHPDNDRTGDAARFRAIHEAYLVLNDPEKRRLYDVTYENRHQARFTAEPTEPRAAINFDVEHNTRLSILEVLCARRLSDANNPGIFILELEELVGRPRRDLEFTTWYLQQKHLIQRNETSRLTITAEGVDYLESIYEKGGYRRRLSSSTAA
jgi:curved DNA-binding protein CbpA